MFDKQFLQILAVRLSGGLSLDWKEPEPRGRPMPEEEIINRASEAADLDHSFARRFLRL
jgi:hypothetical protein